MLSNEMIAVLFNEMTFAIADNPMLREPQRQGHAAATTYFADGGTRAVQQIPVGCGKTGLISVLPFGIARGRVLVIAPNLTICRQLAAAFDVTKPGCFYRRMQVLTDFEHGPWVATLDSEANLSDLGDAHVVVSNIQQLTGASARWLPNLPEDFFDLIIADEGHHTAATSWREVFDRFPRAKIISLTATPFRADNQPVEGDVIYRYPIAEAMRKGYITNIVSSSVAPDRLWFRYGDDEREHTLEEVMRLRERDWFNRGVALADACNISIVDASIQWMEHLREGGQIKHQIVASACSVDHARRIRALYEERGLQASEIHSHMAQPERDRILQRLETGQLDAIVQVQMLGEGFDHPPLSVAAVFRPYRSLSPYIQFAGRVMRVNRPNAVAHPDNRAVIVSHVGLNIDRHWDDFKLIDEEDQHLVEDWLLGTEEPPRTRRNGRRPLLPAMLVEREQILDRFLTEEFLDVPPEALPDRVLEALQAQGIDPAAAGLDRDIIIELMHARRDSGPSAPVVLPIQPQARRRAQKALLAQRTKSVAKRICDATGLSPAGRKLAARGGTGAQTDLEAVIIIMNRAINSHIGQPPNSRREWSINEIQDAMTNLDIIADGVEANIRSRIA